MSISIALPLTFNDAIALGQYLAGVLRGDALAPADRQALRRVYDALARAGAADWSHDGVEP